MTNVHHELELLARLLVALILAGALGWERESKGKAAGLRTHMLVGLSAALFVVLGEEMVKDFSDVNAPLRLDPIVVLSAVASGISFLGAGSIFVSRDSTVRGPPRPRSWRRRRWGSRQVWSATSWRWALP